MNYAEVDPAPKSDVPRIKLAKRRPAPVELPPGR
jgi:hypothetical protein